MDKEEDRRQGGRSSVTGQQTQVMSAHLVFREGELGLDGTQLIVISEKGNVLIKTPLSDVCLKKERRIMWS